MRYVFRPSTLIDERLTSWTFAVRAWLDGRRANMTSLVARVRVRLLPRRALSNLTDA